MRAKLRDPQEAVGYLQDEATFLASEFQQEEVAKLLVARENLLIPSIGFTVVVAIILTLVLMGFAPFASVLMDVADLAAALI